MRDLLKGLRILAVEQFGAGPFGTLHLADLGAEVIKIEHPAAGGDIARNVPPFKGDGDSLYFQSFNRNKRSIGLDLKQPAGRAVFHDLVRLSDAVFSSLRGDQPETLGLTYEHLKEINPRIVCCALTGYGRQGPRRSEPAYDYLMQAETGWMSLTGEPDGPPAKSGLSMVDFSAGLAAMVGLLGGVIKARETGQGGDIDVSLFDTALSMLNYVAIWTLNRDWEPERRPHSAHPSIVPSQVFETQDGWLVVFCAKEKFWRELVAVLDAPELLENPDYVDFAGRLEHREQLTEELAERFRSRTTTEWIDQLRGKVPCAPVNSLSEALESDDPLVKEMLVNVEHPEFGPLRQTATAIHTAGDGGRDRPGPALGQDTDAILTDLLDYDPASIADLRRTGAIS